VDVVDRVVVAVVAARVLVEAIEVVVEVRRSAELETELVGTTVLVRALESPFVILVSISSTSGAEIEVDEILLSGSERMDD